MQIESQINQILPRTLDDVWAGPDPNLPHVLLVVDQFPKALGGGETTVLRLAELLPHYGFRASVLTFAIHPESSVLVAPLSFPLYLLPLERTYDLTALRAAGALVRFLGEQRVLLVQTFFESSDLWAGMIIKTLSSARLVWSRRDMGILRSAKHRLAYRLMAGMPDAIFAVSDRVRQHCIEEDKIDPARVCTIYNGLDVKRYRRRQHGERTQFVTTTVGNIRHIKGHDVMIQAAALVLAQYPEASFSIAGNVLEAGYFDGLQRLVTRLGIEEKFHFVGGVRDVPNHLAGADLFLLPSRSEGFSNAILEAMACALPVIATDVGGNAEAVLNEVTGYIVPPDDPAALARCMLRLARDRALGRRMGAAGRAVAEEKFSTEAMMKQVTSAYHTLLAAHGVFSPEGV